MGSTGFATSEGNFYNHLANPDGSVAWFDEIQSLDLSMGHSDPSATYHYHGVRFWKPKFFYYHKSEIEMKHQPICFILITSFKVPYLIPGASDSSSCKAIGYLFDGFPVHGQCQDENGNEIFSCWKLIGEKFLFDAVK